MLIRLMRYEKGWNMHGKIWDMGKDGSWIWYNMRYGKG